MTTFLERGQIMAYRTRDPFVPAYEAPTDVTAAFVEGAVDFSRRVSAAISEIAHDKILAAISSPPQPGSAEYEQLVFAQKVQAGEVQAEPLALREILAAFPSATPATLASITDAQLKTYLVSIWPVMGEYYHRSARTR